MNNFFKEKQALDDNRVEEYENNKKASKCL